MAPAYHAYQLRVRLTGPAVQDFELPAENQGWGPSDEKQTFTESYSLQRPAAMASGSYTLGLKLYFPKENRDVLLALDPSLRDEPGYYRVGSVSVVSQR